VPLLGRVVQDEKRGAIREMWDAFSRKEQEEYGFEMEKQAKETLEQRNKINQKIKKYDIIIQSLFFMN